MKYKGLLGGILSVVKKSMKDTEEKEGVQVE